LEIREEKYRSFLEGLDDIAYKIDDEGNVPYTNKIAETITGLPLDQIIGKSILDLFNEESRQVVYDAYLRALSGLEVDVEGTFMNGRICLFRGRPVTDGSGSIIGTFGTGSDITDKKLADHLALRQEVQVKRIL